MSAPCNCGCDFDAFVALAELDAVVCKAAIIDEAKRLAEIERRLYEVSMSEFERRARPAMAKLLKDIEAGKATDERSTLMLMSEFDKRFDDLPAALEPFYEKAIDEAYEAGRAAIYKKAAGVYPRDRDITYPSPHRFKSVNDEWLEREKAKAPTISVVPSFSVVDEQAIETLKKHQVFWIGKHYDKQLSNTIANVTADSMIKQGFDRTEGAKAVRSQLGKILSKRPGTFSATSIIPHGWNGSAAQYYEGLAANTMTVARTFGAVSGLRGLGAQTYTISNPVDERTCDVCGALVGTTFSTGDGAVIMDDVLASTNPSDVKNIMRWDTLKTMSTRSGVPASSMGPGATPAQASALASNGYGLPPFHYRCRCVVDIGPATPFAAVTPQGVGFATENVPTRLPGFTMPPLRFPRDLTKFNELPAKASGGVNKKIFFTDPEGDMWMFKPYIPEREYRAYGDVLADHVAQALGHPSSPTYLTRYKGEFGSVQKLYKGIEGELRHARFAALTPQQLRTIQKEHAFDWLISNHDGHGGNLLLNNKGALLGIDKGQAYKFFPKDSLKWSYNPNSQYTGEFSVYNNLLGEYSQGKLSNLKLLTMRDKGLRDFFRTVDALDDETFVGILKPYARARAKQMPDFDADKFLAAALKRKKELGKDMNGIWGEATKQRDALLGKKLDIPKPTGKPITPLDQSFINEVKKAQWKGNSLSVAGDSIRDGNMLVYSIGKDKVVIQARLTSSGDEIARLIGSKAVVPTPKVRGMSELRDEIENIRRKLFNTLQGTDGKLPPDRMEKLFEQVRKVNGLITDSSIKYNRNLDDYMKFVERWWDKERQAFNVVNVKTPIGTSKFEIDLMKKNQTAIRQIAADLPTTIKQGTIALDPSLPAARIAEGIETRLASGIKMRYYPKGVNPTMKSLEQNMFIEINKPIDKLKPKDLQDALDALARRGLAAPLADKQHAEYQLLKSYFDWYQPTRKIVPNWNLPFSEKLALYRKEAAGLFKSKLDLSPKMSYGNHGWFQPGRFDLSEATKKGLRDKYVLRHDLMDDDVLPFLRKVRDSKVGAILSTEERHRVGLATAGMSSSDDMATGGARMGFARVRSKEYMERTKKIATESLYFEPDAGFSMRAYSYDRDLYGSLNPTTIQQNNPSPDKLAKHWANSAKAAGGNETIIEGGLDLGDLKKIYFLDQKSADEAIAILRELEKEGAVTFKNRIESIVEVVQ